MVSNQFSGSVTFFRGTRLPEQATLAGYSALINSYDLEVPLPRILFATGKRHRTTKNSGWHILTPRYAPQSSLSGHLFFALKYEGLDLAVLKRLFLETGPRPIEALVQMEPTGSYARRIWFLYEWQTIEKELPEETDFLLLYDIFRERVQSMADMPEKTINLLFRFLKQNQGRLSKRAREKEFAGLTPGEVELVESIYAELFGR